MTLNEVYMMMTEHQLLSSEEALNFQIDEFSLV